ncbi:MAG: hypothetical protein DCC58_05870 [Chloroflexi bacterium]|nr:MAG: hypothetical protein DCC58_05870 [Chloroflexota bacterium]
MATDTSSTTSVAATSARDRRWVWRVIAVLAALLLFFGSLEAWAYRSFANTDNFTSTTREVLEREDVREVLATRIVDRLLEKRPILRITLGDTLIPTVTGLLKSDVFLGMMEDIAAQLHQAVTKGQDVAITIESREVQLVVLGIVRVLAREDADALELEGGTLRIVIFPEGELPSYEREIRTLRIAGTLAGLLGLLLLVLPLAVRRDLWSLRLAGFILLAVAFLSILVLALGPRFLESQVSSPQVKTLLPVWSRKRRSCC